MKRLVIFYFVLILGILLVAITCGGCASMGEMSQKVIEELTTDPFDPDGKLDGPIWPKKEEVETEPATTPPPETLSNNLDEVIGNGLISILVWKHDQSPPVILFCSAPATFNAAGILFGAPCRTRTCDLYNVNVTL